MVIKGSGCEQLVFDKTPSRVVINNTSGGMVIQDIQINNPGGCIYITSNGIMPERCCQ
jgi:hypothetical protein